LGSIPLDIDEVRIKHEVQGVPEGRTEQQIEENVEYYLWKIYIDGEEQTLRRISKVEYTLSDTSFNYQTIERTNWENKFEYSVFGYGSIDIVVKIHVKDKTLPISTQYYLNIAKSNNKGLAVPIG
jgi:transcription initiation factor IIF auxiliary subunit